MKLYDSNISECGQYRYSLTRIWDIEKPKVMFLMLNPSKADAHNDDPTVRRCIGFAKAWGYGGLYVCNLFAYRSTDPKQLLFVPDPIGPKNMKVVIQLIDKVDKIVCAWGNENIIKKITQTTDPYKHLAKFKKKLYFIQLSIKAIPKHPLYLKKDLVTQKYDR